jgi:hypothetical protein
MHGVRRKLRRMRSCKGRARRIAYDLKVFGNVSDIQLSQNSFLASKDTFEYKFYLSFPISPYFSIATTLSEVKKPDTSYSP